MSSCKMKAIGNKLIVSKLKDDRKTSGGIVLTGSAMSTPYDSQYLTVESIGNRVYNIGIGSKVIVEKHNLVLLEAVEDLEFYTVSYINVLGVIEK